MMFSMAVMCDCSHPEIKAMEPEGIFYSDNDEARCYAWFCPLCSKKVLIRLTILDEEE